MGLCARISEVMDPEWSSLDPVRAGRIPLGLGTPDRYVLVAQGRTPFLRVDVYGYGGDDYSCFQDAVVWRKTLVVGLGCYVHAISIVDRSVTTIGLGSYYGQMYPTSDYLLIASCEHLFRMDPDRSISWKSECLAIDGVVVYDAEPPVIRGAGEWDPPGGWSPFAVFAADGRPAPQDPPATEVG